MSETLIPPQSTPDDPPPAVSGVTSVESQLFLPAEAEIDHPRHNDWGRVSTAVVDDKQVYTALLLADIRRRFPQHDVTFEQLWDAVEVGVARTNAYRVTHERSNQALLQHYAEFLPGSQPQPATVRPVGSAGEVPVITGPNVVYNYETLAGRNATLEHYIPWFGRAALAAFSQQSTAKFNSLSLEIGGVGQAGNWNGTARLDGIVAALPERLRRADSSLVVSEFPHDAKRSYQFIPMREMTGRELLFDELSEEQQEFYRHLKLAEWEFEDIPPAFAMIRRRRPLFDVYAAGGEPVRVFKQSVGLLVLSELPRAARQAAWEASRVYPGFDQLPAEQKAQISQRQERATRLAEMICGAVFERAIRDREDSTTVVPLSMQAIMKVKRPEATQAV